MQRVDRQVPAEIDESPKARDCQPVLLIPGFFAGDWMMAAMARWLARIGYRPYLSGIDWNVGCPGRTVELLGWRIQKIARESGIAPVLVGQFGLLIGIAESRLSSHGYGKTNFVATNKTSEGCAQNRRVELVPNQ